MSQSLSGLLLSCDSHSYDSSVPADTAVAIWSTEPAVEKQARSMHVISKCTLLV